MNEKVLIEAFQTGDEFAFVSIYNRHKGAVYAFCAKMLLDKARAQDAMQDTFLRVYENRARLQKSGSFKAWLFTIARNQCLNQLRRSVRQVPLETEPFVFPKGIEKLEKSEQVKWMTHFLSRLKPEYREVIVLREYQGMSYEEIAAVTRTTISSVKSRLFKARRKLASIIAPAIEREHIRATGDCKWS